MKKTMLIASVLLVGLASCKKEEPKTPEAVTYSGQATISGVVKAELDITNANMEFAPSGTIILLEYSEEDLVLNPSGTTNYQIKTVSTTVGANGSYSATVPTNGKPVDVTVSPQDFEYDQVTGVGTTNRVVYTTGSTNVSVVNGAHKIIDFNY